MVGPVLRAGLFVSLVGLCLAPAAYAAFPGRNGKIAYTRGTWDPRTGGGAELLARDPDGRNLSVLLRCPPAATCGSAAYSRRGTMLALSDTLRLFTARSDGTELRALPQFTQRDSAPAWSPTSELAFTGRTSETEDHIYAVRSGGSGLRRLTSSVRPIHSDIDPAWSVRDRIAFTRAGRGADPEIYTVKGDGSDVDRLTFRGGSQPSWSPHGTRLAFVRDNAIYTVRANGRGLRRITRPSSEAETEGPAWSPDGKRIAFLRRFRDPGQGARREFGVMRIYTVRTDGRGLRRVASQGTGGEPIFISLGPPAWQPR